MSANSNCSCHACARSQMNFSPGVATLDRFQNEVFEFTNADQFDEAWLPAFEIAPSSALNVLSSSELKAVRITSTFETGRAGGFGGLTGNIDGQGLSFGLMNFTIKAGSLIPLLKKYITNFPAHYAAIFGNDAPRFRQIVFATKPDPQHPKRQIRDVVRQMEFVNTQMNALPTKNRRNKIIEPWKNYFGQLEQDLEFQKIQVGAVRKALRQAQKWYQCFDFQTERGFAFMFDLVSSHGGAWLDAPRFKHKRIALLQKMLAAKQAQLGRKKLSELEKMEVIANLIADVSLEEWRPQARLRKLWFVSGAGKVHGSYFDLKKHFGITDQKPVFSQPIEAVNCPTKDWEFEAVTPTFEFENNWSDFFELEQPSPPLTPGLLGKEEAPPAQTLYVKINLGNALPAKTGIFLPKTFNPATSVDLIIYLHGHKSAYPGNNTSIDAYWNQQHFPFFALREEINESGRNVIFVAPSLGNTSQAGHLTESRGFDRYITQVLAAVNEHYLIPRYGNSLGTVGNIILAAHSGGGSAMLKIANLKDQASARIKECWNFDSMYGAVAEGWAHWAQTHPQSTLFAYYGPTKGHKVPFPKDNAESLISLKKGLHLNNICIQPSRAKTINKVNAHFWVPKVHFKERLQNSPCLQNTLPTPHQQPDLEKVTQDSAGIDWKAVRQKAVALAMAEYKKWDQGHRHETNPKFFETLKKYYLARNNAAEATKLVQRIQCLKKVGNTYQRCSKETPPWSAAFISWIMKTAGAGKYFSYSNGHYTYVAAAKRNRQNKVISNPFWAYRISEVTPEVGDLLCNSRCPKDHPERCGATYDTVDNGTEWALHCDLVVEVNQDHMLVIGGNTGDQFGGLKGSTVGLKKVLLDQTTGKIRSSQGKYIALVKFRTNG